MKTNTAWPRIGRMGLVALALPLMMGGCTITFDPNPNDGNNNPNDPDPGTVTIRVLNRTNTTLDPEIYVAGSAVTVSQLFSSSRKYTEFGVGTLGLLGPFGSDSFTLTCAEARVLGTKGGAFGDNLNNPDGTGRQIVLTQELVFDCGAVITFSFERSGGGFTTTFEVEG
ncbi:MAG: hypothetical protein KDA32_01260 [Phycisphaerales bacterium]|nr:hypothetical protein [Phycisphaerales bacterium]